MRQEETTGREARRLFFKVLANAGALGIGRDDTDWKLFARKNCMDLGLH